MKMSNLTYWPANNASNTTSRLVYRRDGGGVRSISFQTTCGDK